MSGESPQNSQSESPQIEQVISAIRTAWRAGRRIIPLVGAGLSADSGIPVIRSLYRYFAKFQQFLSYRAYLPAPGGAQPFQDPLSRYVAEFVEHPAKYVQALGWPDRYDLNQDLLTALESSEPVWNWTRNDMPLIHLAVGHGYREILRILKPETTRSFLSLVERLLPKDPPPSSETVEKHLWSEEGKYEPFQLFEDWRKLIQHFTHYQGEYADVLFHRLCVGRRPNQGHRFLAFLVKLLSIRSVFTFNFDELIEQSLRAEEIDHQVFAMEHGGSLPHPGLVQDITAVVKMHGSTHALLLDERLDHPLDERYKKRFREITGTGPLLLVVGCGGDDYRLRDLLDFAVRGDGKAQVAWIHFESSVPSQIDNLARQWKTLSGHGDALIAAPTNNIGLTLQHIHTALTGRHPASPVRYTAHINRPYRLGRILRDGSNLADDCGKSSFTVLTSLADSGTAGGATDSASEKHLPRTASEMLVDVAAVWNRWGWQTVWVDLEAVHTLAAVAGAIVDQCRNNDVSLAPSVLPVRDVAVDVKNRLSKPDPVVQTAVRRVTDALRRSRYLVVLDGLEAYLWPPTTHHGETTNGGHGAEARLNLLRAFFIELAKQPIGESKVVLGVDHPRPRDGTSSEPTKYRDFVENLTKGGWRSVLLPNKALIHFKDTFVCPQPENDGRCQPFLRARRDNSDVWGQLIDLYKSKADSEDDRSLDPELGWGTALLLLASVRRGRHLVTARRLLRPLFARGHECDEALRLMTSEKTGVALGMSRLEGGGLWMHRPVRDYIYAQNSFHVGTAQMTKLLGSGESTPDQLRMAAAQAFTLAVAHQHLSRLYYAHTFVQSEDAVAFLEYVYHRVSSTRYLSKVLALITKNPEASADGISDAVRAFRGGLTKKGWERFRRGFEVERGFGSVFDATKALDSSQIEGFRDQVRKSVEDQHTRQIKALARSWVRAERFLRTQLPAEQLLHWCDTLLADDIPHRMNHVLIRPKAGKDASSYPEVSGGLNLTAKRHLAEFREAVADFAVKLRFERGDFAGAEQERRSSLIDGDATSYQDVLRDLPAGAQQLNATTVTRVHYLLDIAACQVKQGTSANKQDTVNLEDLKEWIDKWPPKDVDLSIDADLSEARLRCEYLSAEAAFPHTSVFAEQWGVFQTSEGQQKLEADLKRANGYIENGLDALRGQSPRGDARLRSLILEPTAGGSLYLPYRAAFYSLLGRVQWLKALTGTTDDATTEAAFESAYQSFDLALGGLRHSNHQIAAQVELFRVEACLARARLALGQHAVGSGTANCETDPVGLARSKYEAARTGLQRARGHLLTGRRNVIWWKIYYALCAQYHADRLSLALAMLVEDVPSVTGSLSVPPVNPPKPVIRPGDILRRLRRGYEAVRCWIDLQESADAPQRQWLNRITQTLTCAAYGLGWLLLRHYLTPLRAEQTVTPGQDAGSLHAKLSNAGTIDAKAGDNDKLQCDYIRHALVWVGRTSRLIEPDQKKPRIELLLPWKDSHSSATPDEVLTKVRNALDEAVELPKGYRKQRAGKIYSHLVMGAPPKSDPTTPSEAE